MTGFRVALGGAQAYYNVKPDLTTLVKSLVLDYQSVHLVENVKSWKCIAPLGGVYQAGTLSGNPLAMRAGIKMFETLRHRTSTLICLQIRSIITGSTSGCG